MKTNQIARHHWALKTISVPVLTGAMLFATHAFAADAISSKVDVTQAPSQFNGNETRAISLSASRILMHVDNALDALADKKNAEASTNIDKGLTLVKILDGVLPATMVKTEINGAGVTYTDDDRVTASFVPIYREFDSVDVMSPIVAQKQAKPAAKNAPAPTDTAPAIAYEGTDYSSVKLDLRLARRELLAAQGLLKTGDTAAAKVALQDIQTNGVFFEFSSTRLPLSRAMDNLRLAESELKNKHPDQAKAALAAATDALKNYEAVAGESRSKEVQKMQKEIEDVTKNIANQNSETFSKTISAWWDKCLGWF